MQTKTSIQSELTNQYSKNELPVAQTGEEQHRSFQDCRLEAAQLKVLQNYIASSPLQQSLKARSSAFGVAEKNNSSISLLQRAYAGQLEAQDVKIKPVQMNLYADSVQLLNKNIQAISQPEAKPLVTSLQNGAAQIQGNHLHSEGLKSSLPTELSESIAALGPQKADLQIQGNDYRVMAKVNPWLEIANGKILDVDTGPKNKKKGVGWIWVSTLDLSKAHLSAQNAVGNYWPPSSGTPSTTSSNPYSVPSTTFSNLSLPNSFHTLKAEQLPPTMNGYAYNFDSSASQWGLYRDPVVVPSSPLHGIDAEETGGRLHYSSYEEDPQNKGETRVTGAYSQTAAKGNGYGGARDYPMDSSDYVDSSGTSWDRGHAVDHFDGSYASTTSANNYVPENSNFNRGARNHKVQELRRNGGGSYQATYQYGSNPPRVQDGTAIPQIEHFTTYDSSSAPTYYQIPNMSYPASNKMATADQFKQPHSNAPKPTFF